MTSKDILSDLKKAASDSVKKIYLKHGAKEPVYGVKIDEIKKIKKKVKENEIPIALDLFASGVGDAQYLAGLLANGADMKIADLQTWAEKAQWPMISECSVAWVAAEHPDAWKLGLKWIDSSKANVAASGWATLSTVMATRPDTELDMAALKKLLARIEKEIDKAPNRVRSCMNSFVIAMGSYVKELNKVALETGKKIGYVQVDVGDTACKVPFAPDYIKKAMARGSLEKKKKTGKC